MILLGIWMLEFLNWERMAAYWDMMRIFVIKMMDWLQRAGSNMIGYRGPALT